MKNKLIFIQNVIISRLINQITKYICYEKNIKKTTS